MWRPKRDSTDIAGLARDFSDIQTDTLEEKELRDMSYWMSKEKEQDLGQPWNPWWFASIINIFKVD